MSTETGEQFEPDEVLLEALLAMGISEVQAHEALFCTGNESVEAAVNYMFSNGVGTNDQTSDVGRTDLRNEEDSRRLAQTTDTAMESFLNAEILVADAVADATATRHYKMMFVVNKALPMGAGKIAAQVAHACLGLYRQMMKEKTMISALHEWECIGLIVNLAVWRVTSENQFAGHYRTVHQTKLEKNSATAGHGSNLSYPRPNERHWWNMKYCTVPQSPDEEKKVVLRGDSAQHLEQLYGKACEMNIPCYLVSDAGHTQIPSGSITVLSIFGDETDVNRITGGLSLL